MTNHPHLGEVEESTILREVGSALLDEGQVRQVHAEVGDAGRVAPVQRFPHVAKPAVS